MKGKERRESLGQALSVLVATGIPPAVNTDVQPLSATERERRDGFLGRSKRWWRQ